jgi:predicted anti-sigma-YlaC factor YlaD
MNIVLKRLMNIMMWGINKLTSPCDIITKEISESLDHKISQRTRIKIRLHVMFCKLCRRYQKQLTTMHTLFEQHLQKEEENILPKGPTLNSEARERIKQNLREQTD